MTSPAPFVLVIDDDPTGSQVVRDVTLHFGSDRLQDLTFAPGTTEFLLTNTRSHDADSARRVNRRIGAVVGRWTRERPAVLVSRSDSTLRGHIREETQGLAEGLKEGGFTGEIRRILCPAYISAGRITQGNVHYCDTAEGRVPVGESPFARDPSFSYSSSDLREFLVERGLAVSPQDVLSVETSELHGSAVDSIVRTMDSAGSAWVVLNATEERHVDVLARAIHQLARLGRVPLVRSGPSLVRALAGQPIQARLAAAEIATAFPHRRGHGLVVVGSHVPLASAQLSDLLEREGVHGVRIDAGRALESDPEHLESLVDEAVAAADSHDVALWTSREVIEAEDGLDVARQVSDFVVAGVRRIVRTSPPAWIVAKGGITSHEVAASALEIRSARVVGQLLDGQVTLTQPLQAHPAVSGMPYVIFAGNVGKPTSLGDVRHDLNVALSGEGVGRPMSDVRSEQ